MSQNKYQIIAGKFMSAQKTLVPLLILAIASVVYSLYGFEGKLGKDEAIFLYAGQRMAEGIPPYISIFDHQAPLAYILPGFGVIVSKSLAWDDIYTVRLVFFIVGCMTVVGIYFFGRDLFSSLRAGFFAALVFAGFFDFSRSAVAGPHNKTPMVLFETLSLVLTSQRKWFWAGVCGSLAFLTWQPMVILPLVTLVLAVVESRQKRLGAIVRTLAGVGLPVVIIIAYFQYHGALYELFEGAVLFNIRYLDRRSFSLLSRFLQPVVSIFSDYEPMTFPILIGLLMVGYLYIWRRAHHGSFQDTLTKDIFAPVLLSFPLVVLWSFVDFQGATDFYIFLPYIAIGFGKFLDIVVGRVSKVGSSRFLESGLGIILIVAASIQTFQFKEGGLGEQRQAALEIERRFGSEVRLLSIGMQEVLVLLHKTNPTRFVYITAGVDSLIHDTTPDGFEGWIQELRAYDPDLVAFGWVRGIYTEKLRDWVTSQYHKERVGPWRLYVRDAAEKG